jgi:RND family efflux transporter MFP subunit
MAAGKRIFHMIKIVNTFFKYLLPGFILAIVMMAYLPRGYAAKPAHPNVITSQVEQGTIIDEIKLSGTVSSPRVTRLSAEVSGLVNHVYVDAGSLVNSGQPLLSLDTELENLSLKAAKATAQRAAEELADAERRFEDGKRLAKKKTLSANELKSLEAGVNIARATLQRYTAEKQLQQARLERHQLVAPFAGVISQKFVEIGEWIKPGDTVMELVANENLRIDFQVPQQEFPRIDSTSEISITLDALPDKVFNGVIQTVVPYSDSDARTFLLRVSPSDPSTAILPGMSASGLLRLTTGSQGIIVSRDAVLRYPDGRITVWVVEKHDDNMIVSERRVKTGSSFNNKVSILDGLKSGDQVVVEGNESLKDGQTVTLKNR